MDPSSASDNTNPRPVRRAKNDTPHTAIMFQTTRINSIANSSINNQQHNAQFKYNIPASSFNLLQHEFSRLKYDPDGKGDFKGFPDEIDVEYSEEEFDYDQVKLDLTVEGDPFITKDKVNPKETLKLLEINAL